MLTANLDQRLQVVDELNTFATTPIEIEVRPERDLDSLLAALSPDTPWGDRKMAALELGYLRCQEALPGLLEALPVDPFWMVRCAIIQALEMIGHPEAIPTLQEVVESDGFQIVRSYAAEAIERLSKEG